METINVTIYNSEYKLRGDDSEAIRKAAAVVDEQMRFVATKAPMQPATTTAVLAALNTAEQLLSEQRRAEERRQGIADRLDRMTSALDELIAEPESD